MMHKLVVIQDAGTIGWTLFDDGEISMDNVLLCAFVSALMDFTVEMGSGNGTLRSADLGNYKISVSKRDNLVYVTVQDVYDNSAFILRMLNLVVSRYHKVLREVNMIVDRPSKEMLSIIETALTSAKFPRERLPMVESAVQEFFARTTAKVDTFFLADLDDGLIHMWRRVENQFVVKTLMELLAEVPFEKHWVGETYIGSKGGSRSRYGTYEGWFIWRMLASDYCILLRAFYSKTRKRELVAALEWLSGKISSIVEKEEPGN